MSFSGEVKAELGRQMSTARHCQIAELAAMLSFCGNITIDSRERFFVKIRSENLDVARKCFTLLRKTFNIKAEMSVRRTSDTKSVLYCVAVTNSEQALKVLQATKLLTGQGEILEELSLVRNIVMQQTCCKRAFLRGAFLAGGSISDPKKSYHFEIVCTSHSKAEQIQRLMFHFGLEPKIVCRKKTYVVYLKEGSQIVDVLNVMEAPVALMELENVRILKEMRNDVNRKVNCETANIHKTVSAAVKQVEDIRYIRDTIGFDGLSEGLVEIAEARLKYPEATLKELGELLETPVGKSGVNHRLRKLGEIADKVRENKEEVE